MHVRWTASLISLFLLLAGARSWAATYTMPGDFPTIQAALNAAAAGDAINVASGTYFEKLTFPRSGNATVGSITLQAGAAGRARISLTGRGTSLVMPPLPLNQSPTVTVQLSNSAGICWSAEYSAPALTNTGTKFKDKSD